MSGQVRPPLNLVFPIYVNTLKEIFVESPIGPEPMRVHLYRLQKPRNGDFVYTYDGPHEL